MRKSNTEFSREMQEKINKWVVGVLQMIETLKYNTINEVIKKQLIRSATSVGANYAEAVACGTVKGFALMVEYSLKSGNESKYWLELIKRVRNLSEVEGLINNINEITNILAVSIKTLRNK